MLDGKIGAIGFGYKDFVLEVIGHYEMFIEPYKTR